MNDPMLILPRISEKSYLLSEKQHTYTVVIPGNANKQTVAAAITARFKVTVEAVNIMNSKGKPKRTVRKGGRATQGSRSDSKKAYVTLKAGDKLPFFVEPDAPKKGKKSAVKKEG